uniref:tail fiber protein n=1 Tax=Xenorhabdus entomophaga TaxID=3136257 RepID=UPI0030F3C05E
SLDTRTGGGINGDVTVKKLITSSLALGSGSLEIGSRDAASFEGNNIEICSWFGVGFKTTCGNPNDVTSIYFNTRTGDIATQGSIAASQNISANGDIVAQKNISAKGTIGAEGGFVAGSAAYSAWGDITGPTWGGFLSHWIDRNLARKNSAVLSDNGWFKDESTGLIMQWGSASISNRNFNFPRVFDEKCFAVFVTNTTSQGDLIDNAFGYPINQAEFFAATKNDEGRVGGFPIAWWAIGK